MGFEDLIALLVRRWKLILACFSLCLLIAVAVFKIRTSLSNQTYYLAPSLLIVIWIIWTTW